MHMRQLCQYIYIIWTQCNQECDQEHKYTFTSQYEHLPLSKYTCDIAHLYTIVLLLWSTYISCITVHTIQKNKQQSAIGTPHSIANMCQKQIALKCHTYQIFQYIYLTWTCCNQQCDQEHSYIYIFLIGIYPWEDIPATSHKYVPLHWYCSLHIDPRAMHTSFKNQ